MSETVYENSGGFADRRLPVQRNKKNLSEEIYMNNVSETSALAPSTGGYRCYRLAVVCLLMLVVFLLAATAIMWIKINNLTIVKKQLETSYNNLTARTEHLKTGFNNLTTTRDQLETNFNKQTAERDQLQRKAVELEKGFSQLKEDINTPGWRYFNSSIYYISTAKKIWLKSREECKQRGADLVIISNGEEQGTLSQSSSEKLFMRKSMSHIHCRLFKDFVDVWKRGEIAWIGANDIDREGVWKWVDGTAVINGFWSRGEPNQHGNEDCAVSGYWSNTAPNWVDISCENKYIWICEKNINS